MIEASIAHLCCARNRGNAKQRCQRTRRPSESYSAPGANGISSYAEGTQGSYPAKLCRRFDCSSMSMNAPSAVEAQRRDPHIIPVGIILVWRRVFHPLGRPDELLVLQNVDGRFHVRIVGPIAWQNRLSAEVVGKSAARWGGIP